MIEIPVDPALVWMPAHQCGYYPVPDAASVYDDDYFAKYVGYAATDQGRALTAARVALVREYAGDAPVVDLGIGCGAFIEAHGNATGDDVMPAARRWLEDRGLLVDVLTDPVDVLTAWDSLEHLPNPADVIDRVGRLVILSTPIYRDMPHAMRSKHFRPDEHFWYWTGPGLIELFRAHGFRCLLMNKMEEMHGREGIGTFVFQRVA